MRIKLVVVAFSFNSSVARCLRVVENHWFFKKLESLDFLNSKLRCLNIVKNNEGLAFGFQVSLGDKVYDVAIFGEYFSEGFLELFDFDSLLEVFDLSRKSAGVVRNRITRIPTNIDPIT